MGTPIESARADKQWKDWTIKSVTTLEGQCEVSFEEGTCLLVQNELRTTRLPVPGDVLRLYGKGLGYPVRGIGLVEDGRIVGLYRYRTESEDKAEHAREVAESKKRKRAEWETNKDATAATIRALPEPFQKRVEFFMRQSEWGPEFGPYEIFCCTEAVKIADALKTADAVRVFARQDAAEQKLAVPDLDYQEHSGNTFGSACQLALVYVSTPLLLPRFHGALCPLVGCEDYGCWSATAEARAEREHAQ
jgi:hypothetical protein